jgi:hypothetical protein
MAETAPPDTTTTPPAEGNGAPPTDDLAGLSDDARRIVERSRSSEADARREAAAFRNELRETRTQLDRITRQHETERDRDVREAVERDRTERQAEHDAELARLRREMAVRSFEAMAAVRFAHPADAVMLLPVDELLAEADEGKRNQRADKLLSEMADQGRLPTRDRERGPLVTQGGRSQAPDGRTRERSWLRG